MADVRTRVVRVPTASLLLVDIPQDDPGREFVMLELGTDQGITGIGITKPLYALLGGYRDCVPAYASGALPRSFSTDLLVQAARQLAGQGFRQMKMQLGGEPHADGVVNARRPGLGLALSRDAIERFQIA